MRDLIKKYLFKKNLQLKRVVVEDFRQENISPIEALFKAKGNKILLSIPVEKCRTQLWHTLEVEKNPFVQAILEYEEGIATTYEGSKLEQYYREYQPETAAEVLRLPNNDFLKSLRATEFVLPWDNRTPEQLREIRNGVSKIENRENGLNVGLEAGYTEFGPVKKEKGEVEYNRLIHLHKVIRKQRYKEVLYLDDGVIKGYFIKDDENWCFNITSGKHRSYVLAAMKQKYIPVVIDLKFNVCINKIDNRNWFHVKNSNFIEKDVNLFFNQILNLF